jgi:hypothetical protein
MLSPEKLNIGVFSMLSLQRLCAKVILTHKLSTTNLSKITQEVILIEMLSNHCKNPHNIHKAHNFQLLPTHSIYICSLSPISNIRNVFVSQLNIKFTRHNKFIFSISTTSTTSVIFRSGTDYYKVCK